MPRYHSIDEEASFASTDVKEFASVFSGYDSAGSDMEDYSEGSPDKADRSYTQNQGRRQINAHTTSRYNGRGAESRDNYETGEMSYEESTTETPSVDSSKVYRRSTRQNQQNRRQTPKSVASVQSKFSRMSVMTPSVVGEESQFEESESEAESGSYYNDNDNKDDEKIMEASDVDTVVDSVIRSLASKRKGRNNHKLIAASIRSHSKEMANPSLASEDFEEGDSYERDSEYDPDYDRVKEHNDANRMGVSNKQVSGMSGLSRVIETIQQEQAEESVYESAPVQFIETTLEPLNLPPSGRGRTKSARPPVVPPSIPKASAKQSPQKKSFFSSRKSGRETSILNEKSERAVQQDLINELNDSVADDSTMNDSATYTENSFRVGPQDGIKYDDSLVAYDNDPQSLKGLKKVPKEDLELRDRADAMLIRAQFFDLIALLQKSPRIIGIQSGQPHGRTLLHLIAVQQKAVPENVILKIISYDVLKVSATDNQGNSALHYAALNARKSNMHVYRVFQKFDPLSSLVRNKDGDLPLHLAAANPHKGAEIVVYMLLESNSKAVSEPNNKGKIPLHLALTVGSSNLKTLKTILYVHKARQFTVAVKDNRGNTPLHTAIMSGTSYAAIELFNKVVREIEMSAYTKENDQRYLPLHLALMMKYVNPMVVFSLCKAAPYVASIPTPSGDMPICLATKQDMRHDIIKGLLAADLPIELGNKKGNASMGALVERDHGHSWWHIAIEKRNKYVDVITSLLTDFATFTQVVALARSTGPDNKTTTMEAASRPLQQAIRNMLRFYYRYEITTNKMPITTNDVQSFSGIDHGEELEKMKVKGPWLRHGFTEIEENANQSEAKDCGREISYVPWKSAKDQVTLRCYAYEEHFKAETAIRERYNLSTDFVEEVVSFHSASNYINASFTSGKLLCIAFERNDLTFGELMKDPVALADRSWLQNTQCMLSDIADALGHLHNKCLAHGCLDLNAVARFGEQWKLLDIGSASAMGDTMSGSLRKCAPPEALSGIQKPSADKSSNRSQGRDRSRNRGRSQSRSRSSSRFGGRSRSRSVNKVMPGTTNMLPPKITESKEGRKKFGVFMFGMNDLGLGAYGSKGKTRSRSRKRSAVDLGSDSGAGVGTRDDISLEAASMDSSIASDFTGTTDEGSLRVIAMQEDEIARLRKALEEKEFIYRQQLAEERADFKRQEVQRVREIQNKLADEKAKRTIPRFSPEKVMASASWDIWCFGQLMAESIIGKSDLLPSAADTDDLFLIKLSEFNDIQLSTICEEVRDYGGEYAADLVARLMHPKPEQRIESMQKALQHKYFHTGVENGNCKRIQLLSRSARTASKEEIPKNKKRSWSLGRKKK